MTVPTSKNPVRGNCTIFLKQTQGKIDVNRQDCRLIATSYDPDQSAEHERAARHLVDAHIDMPRAQMPYHALVGTKQEPAT